MGGSVLSNGFASAVAGKSAYRASLLAARGVADPDISDTEAWEDYENSLLDVQATSKALLETMGQLRQRELERAVNLVGHTAMT